MKPKTNKKGKVRASFKDFKYFLAEKCNYLELYKEGKYDRKIYNWFKNKIL